MKKTFSVSKETVDNLRQFDVSIQRWSSEHTRLELQKQGILDTIRTLSQAKSNIIRLILSDSGINEKDVESMSFDSQTGELHVVFKDSVPASEESSS